MLIAIMLRKHLSKTSEPSQNPLPRERVPFSQDPSTKPIRAKIDFDGGLGSYSGEKIIPTDLYVFREEVFSLITNFIRSIPSSALELHPIFDNVLIAQGGAYKSWTIVNYSNISVDVKITCADKKGILRFYFSSEHKSIYSDFDFEGEKTVLGSIYYIPPDALLGKRIIKFSKEDLFNQKEQPVLISVTNLINLAPLHEDETPYYDYFFFMDYLIKVDKTLGDLREKTEIVKEFYFREKETGRLYFEERWEKTTKEYEEPDEQRRIPENVKREVWRRDGGKCSRCGSREKLEYDHIIPYSKGGSNTARNIELLCQDCNRKKTDNI